MPFSPTAVPTPEPELRPLAVETRGLCRRYGRTWALVDLDLALPAGASLLLAGHNGSGKSTLLKVLAGALRPDRGTVRIDGSESRDELRRRTALLSHQAFTYEPLTALQNLRIAADFLGVAARADALMARLEEVALAERAHEPVHTFSAGMRKRLAIARLLLQEPSVALVDEPYAQLDPSGFKLIDSVFERMRSRGVTLVIASHLLERSGAVCDRALLLQNGRAQWSGRTTDLLTHVRSGRFAVGAEDESSPGDEPGWSANP